MCSISFQYCILDPLPAKWQDGEIKGKKRRGGGVCDANRGTRTDFCRWVDRSHSLQRSSLMLIYPIDTNTVILADDAGTDITFLLDHCCWLREASGEWNSALSTGVCGKEGIVLHLFPVTSWWSSWLYFHCFIPGLLIWLMVQGWICIIVCNVLYLWSFNAIVICHFCEPSLWI